MLKKIVSKGTSPQIKNKSIKLKLENLRLLSESELREWRRENLKHSIRDISVFIPENANPKTILEAININKHLAACEISDIYRQNNSVEFEEKGKNEGELAVTYRITIFGDCNADSIETEVISLLSGLGCNIRKKG